MNKEKLIQKWLNNELNTQELEAFKKLEDYNHLIKLHKALNRFKPDEINTTQELNRIHFALKSRTKKQNTWLKPLLRVAAIFAICFGFYYFTTTLNSTATTTTQIAQKQTVKLPDNSLVVLNAASLLSYDNKNWTNSRNLTLNGEAYFKVAKGEKFTVQTKEGTISVLGTEFNVKQRNNIFEVICYEGSVEVKTKDYKKILTPKDRFLILNNRLIENLTIKEKKPYWINNESVFKSMPLYQVISEFERQYNVTINYKNIDTTQLFTGSFAHDNIEIALKTITLPLNLTYTINNNKISLKRE